MKALAIGMVYVTAAGLVTLAVERYEYSPGYLLGMALAGIGLIVLAVTKKDSQ
jgi:hypothetical protein